MFLLDKVTDNVGHMFVEQSLMREIVFEIASGSEISELFLFGCEGRVAALKFDVLHVFA